MGILIKGVTSVFTKFLLAAASEAMIEWAFFKLAESIAKSTKTAVDDEALLKIKEAYKLK